jgi:excisionase family DNA binding protein
MKKNKTKSYQQVEWLTPKEFADLTGFAYRTILEHIRQKRIPVFQLGRECRIHHSFLDQFKQLKPAPEPASEGVSVGSVTTRMLKNDLQPPKTTLNNT